MRYESGMLLKFRWEQEVFGICKVISITETNREPIVSIAVFSNYFEQVPEPVEIAALKPMITHIPLLQSCLADCTPVGRGEVRTREMEAYRRWLEAFQKGRSGYFDKSVSEAINQILEKMLEVPS